MCNERKTITSLGLKVAPTNVSWALVNYEEDRRKDDTGEFVSGIIDAGSREIPLTVKERQSFERAEANKEAADRHLRRSARRRLQRYRQRRDCLENLLNEYGMLPQERDKETFPGETLSLRARAASERIELQELGRVFMHINKKRGFKSNRKDRTSEGKDTEYKQTLKQRNLELQKDRLTIGQWLIRNAKTDPTGRTKGFVFYRKDHEDEFDRIWDVQKAYHPELTDNLKRKMRKTVIFYQRRIKSQKHLISVCPYESFSVYDKKSNKKVIRGPRVAPRSSPLFQEFRMWCDISNIRITDTETGARQGLSVNDMETLADRLRRVRKLSGAQVCRLLKIDSKKTSLSIAEDGILGNQTTASLYEAAIAIAQRHGYVLPKEQKGSQEAADHLKAALRSYGISADWFEVDFSGGINAEFHKQPAMMLWHLLHSYIEDESSSDGYGGLIAGISEICGTSDADSDVLMDVKLPTEYGSCSSKAISRLLPYLKEGLMCHEAEALCGYNKKRVIDCDNVNPLDRLQKNALRNPTAEKIINQVLGLVEAVERLHGKPDRIVIESDRMLKMSRKRRKSYADSIKNRKTDNDRIAAILKKDFGLGTPSHNDIEKYRLYQELKSNGYRTLYSDRLITPDMLFGQSATVNVDHILPKHLFFDDSFSNKTLEFKEVNNNKGHTTALNFIIQTQGIEGEATYRSKIEALFRNKSITETKRDRLLTRFEDIPKDVIDRQIQSLPYALKVLRERLASHVDDVIVTLPDVTSKIVSDWRLRTALKDHVAERYAMYGLTETRTAGDGRQYQHIPSWNPEEDSRSGILHAVAAAFTKRSWIQYLNTLSSQDEPGHIIRMIKEKETILSGSTRMFLPPLPLDVLYDSVREAAASTIVSVRTQNNVVSTKINRTQKMRKNGKEQMTIVPRGRLHADTVRGVRYMTETEMIKIGKRMTVGTAKCVDSERYRNAILKRLSEYNDNPSLAFTGENNPKKKPVWIDHLHTASVPDEVKCTFRIPIYTIRKRITPELFKGRSRETEAMFADVLDTKARQLLSDRYEEKGRDLDAAFGDLVSEPIWMDSRKTKRMLSVTLYERRTGTVALRKNNETGEGLKDHVNTESNHHIALYKDDKGNYHSRIISFYETVQRAVNGLPPIDREYNRDKGWEYVMSFKKNEMFVLPDIGEGFDPLRIDVTDPALRKSISPYLYRVQALSDDRIKFRLHSDRNSVYVKEEKGLNWKEICGPQKLATAVKVHVDRTGRIVSSGESHPSK